MNKVNILLVDDEPDILHEFKRALNREGYSVDTALNGNEGWEKYLENYYDVVILDWKMPQMNGLQLLEKIDEHHPSAKVIMITGFGDESTSIEAHHHHAFDYLKKPVEPKVLCQKVHTAIERKDGIISTLEKWIKNNPKSAEISIRTKLSSTGKPEEWSIKDILEVIKRRTPEGQSEYQKLVRLTIELLTRGKLKYEA